MRLESTVKFHSPKSPQLSDSPRATATEALSGTDVMAAFGMVQSRAPLGFSAFSGKMNLSDNDKRKAIQLLVQHGMKHCDKVPALRKLETNVKGKVVQTLATFAYQDYCRSAASSVACPCCKGRGVLRKKEVVVKHPGCGEKTPATTAVEMTESLCTKCNGSGVISTSCVKCRGRGVALDRNKTELQGAPVYSPCKQCSGRGYERIPSTNAFRAVSMLSDSLTIDNWKRGVKQFYEALISHIEKEESFANDALAKVTSKV
ncbi:antitermination protein Q [Citrobacter freundii]